MRGSEVLTLWFWISSHIQKITYLGFIFHGTLERVRGAFFID